MNNQKKILLISYTFPPYPGIGGRRWAKFAKYLSHAGYVVHVVCAKNPFNEISLWNVDIKSSKNIKIYELDDSYPIILSQIPKTIYQKLKYKFALLKVKIFTKGTPYDKGIFWKKNMLKVCNKIITEHNIQNVVVSCAPFSCAYNALALKDIHKEINLIVDFRDPWTWGTGYGFSTLSENRLHFEKNKEKLVIENMDCILVPTDEMKNYLDKVYPQFTNKILILPHAYDKDEITLTPKNPSGSLRLLVYGTLYENLDDIFDKISHELKETNISIKLDVYSSKSRYKHFFETKELYGNCVNYYDLIPPQQLFNELKNYDYVLIIQPDYAKDFITTKIYEIIYSRTPIILIANKGRLFDFISQNQLGLCFHPNKLKAVFQEIANASAEAFRLKDFNISDYSFDSVTSTLVKCFKD